MLTVNRWTLFAATPLLTACASVGPKREQVAPDPLATQFGQPTNSNYVGLADLVKTRAENLYDALIIARPTRMRARMPQVGGPDTSQVAVYLNDQYLGGPAELRVFQVREIASVRFLSKVETSLKYGRSPVDGSIVISKR
jgi:hypothetical protein